MQHYFKNDLLEEKERKEGRNNERQADFIKCIHLT
jgi:hypothetical protein